MVADTKAHAEKLIAACNTVIVVRCEMEASILLTTQVLRSTAL